MDGIKINEKDPKEIVAEWRSLMNKIFWKEYPNSMGILSATFLNEE